MQEDQNFIFFQYGKEKMNDSLLLTHISNSQVLDYFKFIQNNDFNLFGYFPEIIIDDPFVEI